MSSSPLRIRDLRKYTIARSLFAPVALMEAIERLGFVQADPIRAPARAQDLTLRHRVRDYGAGELERRYPELPIEEDRFVTYGFLPRRYLALMHPRTPLRPWDRPTRKLAARILDYVIEHGEVHPRQVDEQFGVGTVTNYWGGSSNATTHLLEQMHYRGFLRIARRDNGVRVYARQSLALQERRGNESPRAKATALVELALAKYAPMPVRSFRQMVNQMRWAAPQLRGEVRAALKRGLVELPHTRVDGSDWYWPPGEDPLLWEAPDPDRVRFLAPFDPLVWDRLRFELFWGWTYRFEAYTPVGRRKLGYYALPLLWGTSVVGWGNIGLLGGDLQVKLGFVSGRPPTARTFRRELDAEIEEMRTFLKRDKRSELEDTDVFHPDRPAATRAHPAR